MRSLRSLLHNEEFSHFPYRLVSFTSQIFITLFCTFSTDFLRFDSMFLGYSLGNHYCSVNKWFGVGEGRTVMSRNEMMV